MCKCTPVTCSHIHTVYYHAAPFMQTISIGWKACCARHNFIHSYTQVTSWKLNENHARTQHNQNTHAGYMKHKSTSKHIQALATIKETNIFRRQWPTTSEEKKKKKRRKILFAAFCDKKKPLGKSEQNQRTAASERNEKWGGHRKWINY